MSQISPDNLEPREKRALAALRRVETPLTARELPLRHRRDGEQATTRTVNSNVTRLAENGLPTRSGNVRPGHSDTGTCPIGTAPEGTLHTVVEDVSRGPDKLGLRSPARFVRERERDGERQRSKPNAHEHES